MIKIVHVITRLEVGGTEIMLKRLVEECSKNPDCQQTIISLTKEGSIGRQLIDKGINVIPLGLSSVFTIPIVFYRLMKIFKLSCPDVVYTWMYHADLIGGVVAYFCGIRNIIWGIRNTQIPQGAISLASIIRRICSILSFHIPNKIICCGEAAQSAHISMGYCAKKMVVISNGYDLSSFNPDPELTKRIRNKLGLSPNTKVIGTIGRFDPLKDFNNFVKAASLVCSSMGEVKFLMIGTGLDKNNSELTSWIKKTGYAENFILFGESNPHDLLAAMDIYCLSSKAEGFPNVVAEAMAMRVPCVVTNVGDAAIIVGDTGKVVAPMNAYELSEGLVSMLKLENGDRRILGDAARKLIEQKYDIKIMVDKYLNLAVKSL